MEQQHPTPENPKTITLFRDDFAGNCPWFSMPCQDFAIVWAETNNMMYARGLVVNLKSQTPTKIKATGFPQNYYTLNSKTMGRLVALMGRDTGKIILLPQISSRPNPTVSLERLVDEFRLRMLALWQEEALKNKADAEADAEVEVEQARKRRRVDCQITPSEQTQLLACTEYMAPNPGATVRKLLQFYQQAEADADA